ncbi:hypothetical protein CK510_26680 [Brunnivagina elsteri CCALA 953]|uniref:Uncharacterized protein n=2 Tax=Brunnivagina TaxID=3344733 RepID=A0A2A2TBR8_9CYAN|nr:hypothetical protein CK510_26680 [Calothrix elsteri CCALA 953]
MVLLLATTILIHETTSRSVFAIENHQEKQDATVNLPDNDFNYNNEKKIASDIVNKTNIISGDGKTITTIGNKILQNKQSKLDRKTRQTIPDSQTILLKELRAYSHQQDLSNPSSTILSEKASNQDFIAVTDTNSSNYLIRDLVRNKFQQRQQELLNALKQNKSKQEQILSQSDSSGVVGDTFGDTEKLRQELLIDPIIVGSKTRLSVASPASTAGTPSAYGASSRQAYIGGGLRFPLDSDRDRTDGSLSLGIGEGDAVKSLGIEFNLNITSVGGGNDFDFGDSGSLGFKLHKYFGKGTAVAFGWSNPIRWGDSSIGKPTVYGVVTQAFPLMAKNKLPLTVSIGVGSGAFRSKGAILSRDNSPNLFGSVGLQVIPQLSLVSSWTGNRLNVGVSVVPVKKFPFVINAIFSDITDNLNGGSGLTITAGSGFNF